MVKWNKKQKRLFPNGETRKDYALDGDRLEANQFSIFSRLWAVATLFHMAHSSLFNTQLNFAFLTLAAFLVIGWPRVASLSILAVLQIFDVLYRMPYTTNHWIFTAFVNLSILHAVAYHVISNRSFNVNEGRLYRIFAPVVRIEVIILYFFAVFHKLNGGFFAPLTSCAFDLLKAQHLESILPINETFYKWNPYLTIAIELAIPIMLCIPRVRTMGIIIGIVFHGILAFSSYNAFYDFSSMVFAVYFLFANPRLAEWLYEKWHTATNAVKSVFQSYSVGKVIITAAMVLISIAVLVVVNQKLNAFRTVHLAFWTIYCATVLAAMTWFWFSRRAGEPNTFKVVDLSLLLLPMVVFLNGICPYIGLKTENSYAMFSNLRTEGGETNHFIVPASMQLFNFQKDIVTIHSSSDKGLNELAEKHKSVVLFEFKNLIHTRKPEYIEYSLNGEKKIYSRQDKATHAGLEPNFFLLSKLMRFRSFSITEPQPCSH